MKLVKRAKKPAYSELKVKHYELRICNGSVEPGHASPKASV